MKETVIKLLFIKDKQDSDHYSLTHTEIKKKQIPTFYFDYLNIKNQSLIKLSTLADTNTQSWWPSLNAPASLVYEYLPNKSLDKILFGKLFASYFDI